MLPFEINFLAKKEKTVSHLNLHKSAFACSTESERKYVWWGWQANWASLYKDCWGGGMAKRWLPISQCGASSTM